MMPKFMIRILLKLIYPCQEVTELASASLDRDLPFSQRLRLRLHFYMCVLCRRYHDQIRFIHEALQHHPDRLAEHDASAATGLSPESRDRIKRALNFMNNL